MAQREALILGAGHKKYLQIHHTGDPDFHLTTLDHNPDTEPDFVADLECPILPFRDDQFDLIEACEVLEHIGNQGDWRLFFAQFSEFWRILKPHGEFRATVPRHDSIQTWGDPSHRRVINDITLAFLSQRIYSRDIGKTPMTDFRHWYHADFEGLWQFNQDQSFCFGMVAVKPARRG